MGRGAPFIVGSGFTRFIIVLVLLVGFMAIASDVRKVINIDNVMISPVR